MKLYNLVVSGGLQRPNGDDAQVGDTVRLTLDTVANPDFPETIQGIIESPITKVNCGTDRAYVIEYDEEFTIRVCDVLDTEIVDGLALLDEAKLDKTARQKIVVMLGDSIIRGIYSSWMDDLIANDIFFANAEVHNLAVDGQLMSTVAASIVTTLAPYANRSAQTDLYVFYGTNINDSGVETIEDAVANMETIASATRDIGGFDIPFSAPHNSTNNSWVLQYNPLLFASSEAGNIGPVVDIFHLEPEQEEGVHPSIEGNKQVAKEISKTVRNNPTVYDPEISLAVKTAFPISNITAGNPAVVTFSGVTLTNGQVIYIPGSDSTPTIDGFRKITLLSPTTFSVPVTTTVAGTTGSINTAVAKLDDPTHYRYQVIYLLKSLNTNANGANTESFILTKGFSAGNKIELKALSLGIFANGFGESSPIFDFGAVYEDPFSTPYAANKSASYTYTLSPKRIA